MYQLEIWDFSDKDYFWQYPVITEKQVMTSLSNLKIKYLLPKKYVYLAIPWATIIDKNIYSKNLVNNTINLIKRIQARQQTSDISNIYITGCQHIYFKRIIGILKEINVSCLFASHKSLDLNFIGDIKIMPLQLYAVNIEDSSRNGLFVDKDLLKISRPILYSFTGFYSQNYLSRIRKHLASIRHPKNCYVKLTNKWHFVETVYCEQTGIFKNSKKTETGDKTGNTNGNAGPNGNESECPSGKDKTNQITTTILRSKSGSKLLPNSSSTNSNMISKTDKETENYNRLLLQSRFSLCPSGSGPNSIRLWESLGAGSIPILLADTYHLPDIPRDLNQKIDLNQITWDDVIVKVNENKVTQLPSIIKKISPQRAEILAKNCLSVYQLFSGNNFALHLIQKLQ